MAMKAVDRIRNRVRRWARARHGADLAEVELTQRRVYILPTRHGYIFGIVVFTMLLGALNYSNNMAFALAFLLTALAIVSIHHCQRNLAGLRLSAVACPPAFAGEVLNGAVAAKNPGRRPRFDLQAGGSEPDGVGTDVPANGAVMLQAVTTSDQRGSFECPPIRVSSAYPLGLFRAWTWLYPTFRIVVYPRPAADSAARTVSALRDPEGEGELARGSDDFVGLRSLEPGEPPSRIAWKALARSGELLAKDYRSGAGLTWLDWDALPATDTERKLSLLTRMIIEADRAGTPYGLRIPGSTIEPASSREHYHRCLTALALFGTAAPDPRHGR